MSAHNCAAKHAVMGFFDALRAEVVFKGLKAKKREIPVGKGKEMAALWVKRISPEALFRLARQ